MVFKSLFPARGNQFDTVTNNCPKIKQVFTKNQQSRGASCGYGSDFVVCVITRSRAHRHSKGKIRRFAHPLATHCNQCYDSSTQRFACQESALLAQERRDQQLTQLAVLKMLGGGMEKGLLTRGSGRKRPSSGLRPHAPCEGEGASHVDRFVSRV
jgi:hypothetical protein